MFDKAIVEKACEYSLHNRHAVEASKRCGCYYCQEIYDARLIKNYTDTDDTALCEMCGVDAVIAEKSVGNITEELLKKMHERWF